MKWKVIKKFFIFFQIFAQQISWILKIVLIILQYDFVTYTFFFFFNLGIWYHAIKIKVYSINNIKIKLKDIKKKIVLIKNLITYSLI